MLKKFALSKLFILSLFFVNAQSLPIGWWRAVLEREDGNNVVFNFESKKLNGKQVLYVRNADERILFDNISFKGDSVIINPPLFESQIRALLHKDGSLTGVWTRARSNGHFSMPFTAVYKQSERFKLSNGPAKININGRWAVNFLADGVESPSVGEFKQTGNNLTGTFLTTTGDYRYLEGVVTGDSMKLSCYDGAHAFFFSAKIENDHTISGGLYASGPTYSEKWTAVRDPKASLPEDASAVYLKRGEDKLNFTFPDLEGKMVSINDEKFKNKVVVIQIMGSWCSNCMDETAFMSDYYNRNKSRGIEMISLAYEYTSDAERSKKSLRKFQQRFNVKYPILDTRVRVSDTLRTEKTLPELTPIKMFPTSIILDKKGKVRKIDTGFNGPATGEHYVKYKKEFEETVSKLLAE